MKDYYLDSNAHLPLCKKAQQTYINFQQSTAGFGHPSSLSLPGRLAASALEDSRAKISKLLGADSPNQIFFTNSCTQAAEWGLNIFYNQANRLNKIIKCSPFEHPSISYNLDKINKNTLSVDSSGLITEFGEKDDWCVCLYVQNEIGTIQPIENINGMLFSDMSQAVGKIPVNLKEMNVNVAILGAHKWGGSDVGVLYLKNSSWWEPYGIGSRYFRDIVGSPNVAGIVASAVALEDIIENMPEKTANMSLFQKKLEEVLTNSEIDVICKDTRRIPNTTFVKIPKIALQIVQALSEEKIYVGVGSACGSKHTGPSPLMQALGLDGGSSDFIRISQDGSYSSQDAELIAKFIIEKTNYYRRKL